METQECSQEPCFLLPHFLSAQGRISQVHTMVPEEDQGQKTGVFAPSRTRDSEEGFSLWERRVASTRW